MWAKWLNDFKEISGFQALEEMVQMCHTDISEWKIQNSTKSVYENISNTGLVWKRFSILKNNEIVQIFSLIPKGMQFLDPSRQNSICQNK